jgi:hypothetical protein
MGHTCPVRAGAGPPGLPRSWWRKACLTHGAACWASRIPRGERLPARSIPAARGELAAHVRAWFGEGGGEMLPLPGAPSQHPRPGGTADALNDRFSRTEEDGMTPADTPLNSHQRTNVHALLMSCPYCGAQPGERCQGAESYPEGYTDTLHKGREEELERRLDAATAGLTKVQAATVRRLFVNPSTAEERRAVMTVLLRNGPNR